MKINVYGTQNSVLDKALKDQVVVVIDVLRATTTISAALANGCKEIIPITEIEEAMNITRNYDRDAFLLGGERNAQLIDGFHLSNSPLEYSQEKVAGRTIMLTTTNGTKAIKKASDAKKVILGAFVNVDAISDYISGMDEDVTFVCAGTEGKFSLDDILVVGAVLEALEDRQMSLEMDDMALVCKMIYKSARGDLHDALKNTYHYNRLIQAGMKEDVDFCLTMNAIPVVPIYRDGVIRTAEKFPKD